MLRKPHRARRTIISLILIASFLLTTAGANTALADTEAITDTPIPVVNDTFMNEWTLSDGLLYWATRCLAANSEPRAI